MSAVPTDPREQVLAANTRLYEAFERADLDAMHETWLDADSGVDLVCVHPGWPPLRGWGEVMRSWAVIMANTPYIQFVITDVEVDLLGDTAVVTCSENVLTGSEDPADPFVDFGSGRVVATNVFRRSAQGWRLWTHHASPVLSPEEDPSEEDGMAQDRGEEPEGGAPTGTGEPA